MALFASLARVANFGWSGGGVPGTSRPYRHAQTTANDLLFQDLFSDWKKNIYIFFFSKKLPKQKYLCQFWAKSKSDLPPFTPFPETWEGCVGTFLVSLDPTFMRNRQLSTSSVRIYHQIQKIFIFTLSNIASK